ncbi:DUF2752 domain-containing protein [Candidatus Sumerlaeota bacterium]|nr:DUF2752 domain-containing protein [Candidatus Sumerlaeota bacterium]
MRFLWRRKHPGEFDHELVWSLLTLGAFGVARFLPAEGIGMSICWFHGLTGIPCPSCGSTRSLIALAHGQWGEAAAWNPLASLFFVGMGFYVVYSAFTLLLRRPRLRLQFTSARERLALAAILVLAVTIDWIYLIRAGKI